MPGIFITLNTNTWSFHNRAEAHYEYLIFIHWQVEVRSRQCWETLQADLTLRIKPVFIFILYDLWVSCTWSKLWLENEKASVRVATAEKALLRCVLSALFKTRLDDAQHLQSTKTNYPSVRVMHDVSHLGCCWSAGVWSSCHTRQLIDTIQYQIKTSRCKINK